MNFSKLTTQNTALVILFGTNLFYNNLFLINLIGIFQQLETLDNGKPLKLASYVDIPFAINIVRYYAGCTDKIEGKTIPIGMNSYSFAFTSLKFYKFQITQITHQTTIYM